MRPVLPRYLPGPIPSATVPHCPTHPTEALKAARKGWLCEECGRVVIGFDEVPPPAPAPDALPSAKSPVWREGLHPDDMPSYLAHPWASYCAETNPKLKLHDLVDAAEVAVRWSVAVALAEVAHASGGVLTETVARQLRPLIEGPTLGAWLAILRALSGARPASPLVAPRIFDLSGETFDSAFRSAGDEALDDQIATSLLALRNHVAHSGGGISAKRAAELVDLHAPGLEALWRAVVRATNGVQVVVLDGGETRELKGLTPRNVTPLAGLLGGGPFLVGRAGALPLAPLALFAAVRVVGRTGELVTRSAVLTAQVYARSRGRSVAYTPLGEGDHPVSEETGVEAFRSLFRLDEERKKRAVGGGDGPAFGPDDFLVEARLVELVGRTAEIEQAKAWLKGRNPRTDGVKRVGYIAGGPGIGKSAVVAKLAAMAAGDPKKQGAFYHRFRAGDARCSREAFLGLLRLKLGAWEPLAAVTKPLTTQSQSAKELLDDVTERLNAIVSLPVPAPSVYVPSPQGPRLVMLLDGLDEVAASDPAFAMLAVQLAVPGVLVILAGRPEFGLDRVFATCDPILPGGDLGGMTDVDVRTLLVNGLGRARKKLVNRDIGETLNNPFVSRVIAAARGLPLYVHLLLEDLDRNELTVFDEDKLPNGLIAYYDAMIDRVGLSTVRRDLPLIVALLALTKEPVDRDGLALLLARMEGAPVEEFRTRVDAAVRAGRALLRPAPTRDGTEGVTLYHQSFRDYVGGTGGADGRTGAPPAPALAGVVRSAARLLATAAGWWAELDEGAIRNHLFRWGVGYGLEVDVGTVRARLTDFAYLMARTKALTTGEVTGLVADFRRLKGQMPDDRELRVWEAFFMDQTHVLRRGDAECPTERILLQLAVEHADSSPVTIEAERWLERGGCDWFWLRRARRPAAPAVSPCLRVFEGHTTWVGGARVRGDHLLSWAGTDSLHVWNLDKGEAIGLLNGHSAHVRGALFLDADRVLSWSNDGTLRVWDLRNAESLEVLRGHTDSVYGALSISGGRLLSWSKDGTLRAWDESRGKNLGVLSGHKGPVWDALELADRRLLSWSSDSTLRLWHAETFAELAVLSGHAHGVRGALELGAGRLLSWSADHSLRTWAAESGECLSVLDGHTDIVEGALCLDGGRMLSWSKDNTLRIWETEPGTCALVLAGHAESIRGALVLDADRVLSWSVDGTLRVWDVRTGDTISVLEGHADEVVGALRLTEHRLVSWAEDNTLRLWELQTGECVGVLDGHSHWVQGCCPLDGRQVLSWSADTTLRLWNVEHLRSLPAQEGHSHWVRNHAPLEDGRLLSYSNDGSLRVWSAETGQCIGVLRGHRDIIEGAAVLGHDRVLSWSKDSTLRLWDVGRGKTIAVFEGHKAWVKGLQRLDTGRCVSWSEDSTLRVWDEGTGESLLVLSGHEGVVRGAVQLRDHRLLSWSDDKTLRLWNSESGESVGVLRGHTGRVRGALPLAVGRLVSWSDDHTLRLWDGLGAEHVMVFAGHTKSVYGAWLLPNGRLASWSADKTLALWSADTGDRLCTLCGHTGPVYGAMPLGAHRLLSWSAAWDVDRTLRLWDADTGEALGVWLLDTAAREAPEVWAAYCGQAGLTTSDGFLAAEASGASVRALLASKGTPVWHGDGILNECRHVGGGTVAVCCGKELLLLQLYHRHLRVTDPSAT